MNALEYALEHARRGFKVFPVLPNSKISAVKDFTKVASDHPDKIDKMFRNPKTGEVLDYNIGIMTSRFNGTQALIVVDADVKNGKDGIKELKKLKAEGYLLPKTLIQQTVSGGFHFIYRCKSPAKQGTDVLGKGIDIRANGGYILGAGSKINGKMYTFKDQNAEIAEAPAWVVERCGTPYEKDSTPPPEYVDQNLAAERSIKYLENNAPLAVQGDSGDATTYKVAAKIKDFGVTEEQAFSLMFHHWNDRCSPPWEVDELKTKVKNAYQYGMNPVGANSPEAAFDPIEKPEGDKSPLEKMNDEYALVFNNGEPIILHETFDVENKPTKIFYSESAFTLKFRPDKIQRDSGAAKNLASLWLEWKGRREYKGLVFKPALNVDKNYYNLWSGFTVEPMPYAQAGAPAKLGFEMFLSHIKENVAQGNKDHADWIIGYFAHLIQKPYEKPMTAMVLKGRKGVGKNVLVDRIGKLLGKGNYLTAHDGRYLSSNFNGHMDSCLCLVLDEAFWSGDKRAEGALKSYTTSSKIIVERKNKEAYEVDNYLRIIIIGNEDWLVPASYDERRYAIFEVGEGKMQDQEYFKKLKDLLDNQGGLSVLMHYLQNFDLSKVDINTIPNTSGLQQQKIESLNPAEAFWYQCLSDGYVSNSHFNEGEWEEVIDKDSLLSAYQRYAKSRNIRGYLMTKTKFTQELNRLCPSINSRFKEKMDSGITTRKYKLPSLEVAREEWDILFKTETDWADI